ncbi:MAG TPA: M42 family metallopeptidase [Sumerlaeia bacterium]|nr:M42 family metallopeptidase [Sumerlaeia bacterium]
MTDLLATLRALCDAFGPPGFEQEVRRLIRSRVEPYADEIAETILGNLIATRHGCDSAKTVLLDAHVDEVGLIITRVEDDGFLRFTSLGGIDPRVVPAQRVAVRARDGSKRLGVIGVLPPHVTEAEDRKRAFAFTDLFIDLGCSSADQVRARNIDVGSPAVVHADFTEIEEGCVTAKALDDRAGCALVIGAFQAMKDQPPPVNVVASFTVQEETGGLGAETAAYVVRPEVALVLEGTTSTDTPGVSPDKMACALRKGPVITVADARTIVPEKMVRYLQEQAREGGIPHQFKTPGIGGTNGRLIQRSRGGVLTGILSVPCRYIHSSTSVLCSEDLEHTLRLVNRFIANATRLWDSSGA